LLGQELGGCRILQLLGRGAMGAVYKARQLSLDREVAVKVIRPELLTDPRILKRFEVEARTVGRFNSQHVVMVHDVGFDQNVHFLVMEFVQGKNLRDYTKQLPQGRLSVTEALPLLRQACQGLEEAQRLGVLHRDIKPDNLMLTDRGVLKIADFGIAKPAQEDFSMTLTSELIGTPLYMSPEQCQAAADLDFRSDMYSLGATFYYLLTGEPPIRASSVYELIQTKSKLENLCLWKALAELDENHPLSRVIERMTALDRKDRYASYAALIADLALVEQGRTLEIQRTQGASAVGAAPPPPPKRGAAALLAAVVLAGGGGFAFWEWGGGKALLGSAVPAVDVAVQLQRLRDRLSTAGPSAELRAELAAVPAGAGHAEAQTALLADVDRGIALRDGLTKLGALPALALPFQDLRDHLDGVQRATEAPAGAGPELAQWLAGQRAQLGAGQELGAKALARLLAVFATWLEDRQKAGGDAVLLAQLAERLTEIDAAYAVLAALPEAVVGNLREALPAHKLRDARNSLATAEPVVLLVDVSGALAEIRQQFEQQGPLAALENRLRDLRPNQPDQLAEKESLLNTLQRADAVLGLARALRAGYPLEPQMPFDDVVAYYTAIDRELQPLSRDETGLPVWATQVRDELRDAAAMQQRVVERCRNVWQEWQQQRAQANPDLGELELALGRLRTGVARARELFPTAAGILDADLGERQFSAAVADLGRAGQVQRRLAATAALLQRLERLPGIADWRATRATTDDDLAQAKAMVLEFPTEAALAAELRRAEAVARRWQDADARLLALTNGLAAGNLVGTDATIRTGVVGTEGRDEFQAFAGAATKLRDAFVLLAQDLDLEVALKTLDGVQTALRPHAGLAPSAIDRISRWSRALRDVRSVAAGMVPVTPGRTKAGAEVEGFYLGRTEVRAADYLEFLNELQATLAGAGASDAASQQQALAGRLGELVPPAEVLQRMLARRSRLTAAEVPIDDVCWWEAAAYAAWKGLALPTAAEWALAAFGDGHRYQFPWGNDWKDSEDARNIRSSLLAVEVGGRSWRAGVHHLAGNVAEWLAASPSAADAQLAGGSYRDNDVARDVRRRAAGEEFPRAALKKNLPGFGFRVVLRPQALLAKEFHDQRFPAVR
jgi:formylglycine-generating enzyme required for sulfatase activity/tRNA A-37 threonylcarbamoyl transferase component Bud32